MLEEVYESAGGDDMLLFVMKGKGVIKMYRKICDEKPGPMIDVSKELSKFVMREAGKLLKSYPELAVEKKLKRLSEGDFGVLREERVERGGEVKWGEEEEERFSEIFRGGTVEEKLRSVTRYLEGKEKDELTDDIAIIALSKVYESIDGEVVMGLYRAIGRHEPMRCRLEGVILKKVISEGERMDLLRDVYEWVGGDEMVWYSMKARVLFELGRRVVDGGDNKLKGFVIERAKKLIGEVPLQWKKLDLKCISLGKSGDYIWKLQELGEKREKLVEEEARRRGVNKLEVMMRWVDEINVEEEMKKACSDDE
jgi:hypothetical protein